LYANAIGAEPHQILRFAVLLERLREVFCRSYVEDLVPMPTLFDATAVRDQVDAGYFTEPGIQGENLEPILVAAFTLKGSVA
jgi:hypothetical protein